MQILKTIYHYFSILYTSIEISINNFQHNYYFYCALQTTSDEIKAKLRKLLKSALQIMNEKSHLIFNENSNKNDHVMVNYQHNASLFPVKFTSFRVWSGLEHFFNFCANDFLRSFRQMFFLRGILEPGHKLHNCFVIKTLNGDPPESN